MCTLPKHELIQVYAYILGVDEGEIHKQFALKASPKLGTMQKIKFDRIVKLRCKGIPLQHLLKRAYFYGYEFAVSKKVFIPRPETEVLVEHAVRKLVNIAQKGVLNASKTRILDLCCGTGAIGVSVASVLAKNGIQCEIDLVDINPHAVQLAASNAEVILHSSSQHTSKKEYRTVQGDAVDYLKACESARYDAILCNPPYVPGLAELAADGISLSPEVLRDPHNALFGGGEQGFGLPARIIENCAPALKSGGVLYLEHYDTHANLAKNALALSGEFTNISSFSDLNGIPRFTTAVRV